MFLPKTLVLSAALFVLSACTATSQNIPASAREMASGTGDLSVAAPYSGWVYVYDADRNQLIYSGKVHRNDMISVQPGNDRVTVDNQVVTEHDMHNGDRMQIFFDRREEM